MRVRSSGYKLVTALSLGLSICLVLWSGALIHLWTGVDLTLRDPTILAISLACLVTFANITAFQQVFLTAMNDMSRQSITAFVVILFIVPLKLFLLRYGALYGIIIATAVAYFVKLVYYDFIVRRHLGRMSLIS